MKIFVIQKENDEAIVESEKKVEEEKYESNKDKNLEMSPHGDVIMDVCINIFGRIVCSYIYILLIEFVIYEWDDDGSLMDMDNAFNQLRTQLFDVNRCGSSSSCQSAFNAFEAKYTKFNKIFVALRENRLGKKGKQKEGEINSKKQGLDEVGKDEINLDEVGA